jgi:Tol biopolymer transport system component
VDLAGAGGEAQSGPLIASTQMDQGPNYSPDGRRIAFSSDRSGNNEIWVADSDGRTATQLTHFEGPYTNNPSWSPDGKWIAFDSRPADSADIYVIPAAGGKPRNLTSDPSSDVLPSWSHDGRWIYFTSNRGPGAAEEIWKMPADGGPATQLTHHGGRRALESPDGRFVYFAPRRARTELWRIPVEGGAEEPVSNSPLVPWGGWQVMADGIYFQEPPAIKFFRFDTGRSSLLTKATKPMTPDTPSLAVSPDRRWLLYDQIDTAISNVMLMENFR